MAEPAKKESTFMIWLEDALPGWALPVAGIGGTLVVVLISATGLVSDHWVATLVAGALALGLVIALGVPGTRSAIPWVRAATIAGCALSAAIVVYSFAIAVHPGTPVLVRVLSKSDPKLDLPGPGTYRLLVSGRLVTSDEIRGAYVLEAGDRQLTGTIDRSYARRRARRGASVAVGEDHTSNFHQISVGIPAQVSLKRIGPEVGEELTVAVHRALPPWMVIAAVAAAVVACAAVEARVSAGGRCAVVGPAAGAFALMMSMVVPDRTLGPTVGASLISIAAGAAVGAGTVRLARLALSGRKEPAKESRPRKKDKPAGQASKPSAG